MFADASLFRSLASLHRAGVPWPQALASAAGGHGGLLEARRRLQEGATLADALAPLVDPLDRALLRAGEESGTLERTLERIASRHEEETRLETTRRTALAYPVVMAHVAALLAGVPDLVAGRPLAGLLWAVGILAPLWTVLWLLRPRTLAAGASQHPGTTPPRAAGLRRNAVEMADARALLALADSYESGLRLDDTLRLAGEAGAGGRVAWDLYRARPRVAEGKPLSSAWSATPKEFVEELDVGEETGELGDAARHIAARLAFDVEMRRKKFAALAPLGLLLLVGGLVAWRVFSFYSDLYGDLTSRY